MPEGKRARGELRAKQDGVVAGCEVAHEVFQQVDGPGITIMWEVADGEEVRRGERVATVEGPARSILTAERTALNFLMRMSGIATATKRLSQSAKPATLLDTRKTAPGLRCLDKWAVRIGGGKNHRLGLWDAFLIKDNHIEAAGGVTAAIQSAARQANGELGIVVEAKALDQVAEIVSLARENGVSRVLLDNMDQAALTRAAEMCQGVVDTEASGGVSEENISRVASTGVSHISCGFLTHSAPSFDLSLALHLDSPTW